MAAPNVVAVGMGLMTPVGLTLAETAASVRSATARFTQSSIFDRHFEPYTLATIPDDGLPDLDEEVAKSTGLTSAVARMLRLASIPLRACVASVPKHAPLPGLIIALPEMTTTIPLDGKAFLGHLALQARGVFDAKFSLASATGRAGGLAAIDQAAEIVASGRAPIMIAGGVDTYHDLYHLGALDVEGRVKSDENVDGFTPGEGAAFLLLATPATAATFELSPLFALSRASLGFEPGHLYSTDVYRGDGLSSTIRDLVDRKDTVEPISDVYSSMNGESHWAKEWSVAFLRNRQAFSEPHGIHHPADCYGDLGAACGPALVALAGHGLRQGSRRAPALVYCSSDRGARAALIVDNA